MGGEYGAAIVYTSEMVSVERRGLMVSMVQSTINVGLGLAVALVMLLQVPAAVASARAPGTSGEGWLPAARCGLRLAAASGSLGSYRLSLCPLSSQQATVSDYNMLVWGWRIPFLLAFFTAILGFYLRLGMPEPHVRPLRRGGVWGVCEHMQSVDTPAAAALSGLP